MHALIQPLIDWVSGERIPLSRFRLVEEITKFAKYNRAWPQATPRQWGETIDAACKQGLLVETDGKLSLAPTPAKETQDAKQLDLF